MSNSRDIAQNRNKTLATIRAFFNNQDFLEVETPILTPSPGMEPHLTPFETELHHPNSDQKTPLYLNTSPELQMKKLLGAGFQKIYNITKVFRNGELGGDFHNPEFTMLEWYRQKANYQDLMTDCEQLICTLNQEFNVRNPQKLSYQGQEIDLSTPWPRKSTQELFLEYCDIDLLFNQSSEELAKTASSKGYDVAGCQSWDDIYFKIFLNEIEANLPKDKPIFIYDYPASQAALARKSTETPFFAERFELYIAGIELSNAFSELIDPEEQHQRLQQEQEERRQMGKTVFPIDEEFLEALGKIDKPCAGIALGLDRLIMLLTDQKSIKDVLLFPIE
jgi:elongation factor P--(R)-beta-lysine ligase